MYRYLYSQWRINGFYGTSYDFTITGPTGDVVETGQINPGAAYTYLAPIAGFYTVDITDGACSTSFTTMHQIATILASQSQIVSM